jgi:protein-L-isoaspartate(D-aspartate) O-methyltransferase
MGIIGASRLGLAILVGLLSLGVAADTEREQRARAELIAEIEDDVRATALHLGKDALDPRVLEALGRVPRHEFVPEPQRRFAYENRPLPIGHGQTISQPYIVAIMTDLIGPEPDHRVLEIGTGSGYQAAVLAKLVDAVYTIEIIEPLGRSGKARLEGLGYENVSVRTGDGYYGWPEAGPFDAIVVTAAASHVPPPLLDQLKPGGRMIIPVGSRFLTQELLLIEKEADGRIRTRQLLPVRFVPLTGGHDRSRGRD